MPANMCFIEFIKPGWGTLYVQVPQMFTTSNPFLAIRGAARLLSSGQDESRGRLSISDHQGRESSGTDEVQGRPALAEIAKATNWQNHSIRGFLSAQVTKKLKLKVESTKSEAGERTYRIVT